jgi:hypothetical protein
MRDDSFRFYTHNGDRALAKDLGLTDWQTTWEWRAGGWIYLGIVKSDVEEEPWEIDVEVVALPAQFWRFTVRRRVDVEVDGVWEYEPQTIRFSTDSGGLGEFFPVAKMFATNTIGMPELVAA